MGLESNITTDNDIDILRASRAFRPGTTYPIRDLREAEGDELYAQGKRIRVATTVRADNRTESFIAAQDEHQIPDDLARTILKRNPVNSLLALEEVLKTKFEEPIWNPEALRHETNGKSFQDLPEYPEYVKRLTALFEVLTEIESIVERFSNDDYYRGRLYRLRMFVEAQPDGHITREQLRDIRELLGHIRPVLQEALLPLAYENRYTSLAVDKVLEG